MTAELPDLAAWAALARGWPIELGPRWLAAEWARVTPRSALAFGARAAASWLLVDGSEQRTGYVACDLVLGPDLDDALRDAGRTTPADLARCAGARDRAAPLRTARTATITTISSYFPGIVWDVGLAAADAETAARRVVEQVAAAAQPQGAAVVAVANVPDAERFAPLRAALAGLGMVRTAVAPDSELAVVPGGLPAYTSALRASMRPPVRREQREFARAIDRVVVEDAARLRAPDLVPLLAAHHGKYGHADAQAAFCDRLARTSSHGDHVRVLVAEQAGRALGFIALVLDPPLGPPLGEAPGRLVPRLFACADNDVFAYFNLVFYEPVRVAAAWGYAAISLGSTAYRAKLLRGARLLPRSTWLLPLDPGLRGLIADAAAYRSELEAARRDALAGLER